VFVYRGPETHITFNKTVPSNLRAQKLEFLLLTFTFTSVSAQQLPEVLTSYFYFYIRFRAATAVVDGGSTFGIWRVGEEIWVRFFWAKGLGRSWFWFFSWRGGGGGGGGGVLGVLMGGNEPKWEMRRTGWRGSTGCIMHRVHTNNH